MNTSDKDSETLDLWELAKNLTLVPEGNTHGARAAQRLKPRRRRQGWALLIFAIVSGTLCAPGLWKTLTLSADEPPTFANFLGFMGFFSATYFLGHSLRQILEIDALRRANVAAKRFKSPLWWILIIAAYIVVLVACVIAPMVLTLKLLGTDVSWLQTNLLTIAVVGLALGSLAPTFSTPMLNATESISKPGKSVGTITLSTLAFVGVLLTAVTLIIQPEMSPDIVALIVTAALTGFGAVLAWHRHQLATSNTIRVQVLGELINALRYTTTQDDPGSLIQSLRRLQVLFEAGSFRSQSIAAPSLAASWEVCVVLQMIIWAFDDDGKYPEAVRLRAKHPGKIGRCFPLPTPATEIAVQCAARPFFKEAYDRLLASAVR